jgi:predicted N-acyltransferase
LTLRQLNNSFVNFDDFTGVFESKRRSSLFVNKRSHQKNVYCQRKFMPRLRQNEREQAAEMLLAGMAQTQIASHFYVSRMTIYRLMIRLSNTGTTSAHPCSGRPRLTTLRQDRHV